MPRAVTIERIDGKPGQVYYPYDMALCYQLTSMAGLSAYDCSKAKTHRCSKAISWARGTARPHHSRWPEPSRCLDSEAPVPWHDLQCPATCRRRRNRSIYRFRRAGVEMERKTSPLDPCSRMGEVAGRPGLTNKPICNSRRYEVLSTRHTARVSQCGRGRGGRGAASPERR